MSSCEFLEKRFYDAIIIGTGLPECILSAALSVAGATVLHLDPNSFYGSGHATFTISQLNQLASSNEQSPSSKSVMDGDQTISNCSISKNDIGPDACSVLFSEIPQELQVFPRGASVIKSMSNLDSISSIVVDLSPFLLLSAGSLVNLLVESGAGHYITFRPLEASFLYFPESRNDNSFAGRLERVPSSRSDIFQNTFLTNIEKRLLMRFQKTIFESENIGSEFGGHGSRDVTAGDCTTFETSMKSAGLTWNLAYFLLHAVAFSKHHELESSSVESSTLSAEAGRSLVNMYHRSLTRYGTPTPFLYPSYGFSEVCEAFCRLSAVHGGTFVLRRGIQRIYTNCQTRAEIDGVANDATLNNPLPEGDYCAVVSSEGEIVYARTVFASQTVLALSDPNLDIPERGTTWRLIAVLNGSALGADISRAVAIFPKCACGNTNSSVRILQLNAGINCPASTFILSAWTCGENGTEADILAVLRKLVTFDDSSNTEVTEHVIANETMDSRPLVLWAVVFSSPFVDLDRARPRRSKNDVPTSSRVVPVYDVPSHIDAASAIEESVDCFRIARPGQNFMSKSGGKFDVAVNNTNHDEN